MVWRGIGFEWYYPHLQDGVNCVVADSSDMYAKLNTLSERSMNQAKLVDAAWPFFQAEISGAAVICPMIRRWAQALAPLTARQTERVVIPQAACSCDKGVGMLECNFCSQVIKGFKLPQYFNSSSI